MLPLRFRLQLTPDEVRAYYSGSLRWVQVQARDGRTLRFPFRLLRPFVTGDGVEGEFEMSVDDAGTCTDLRRVSSGG